MRVCAYGADADMFYISGERRKIRTQMIADRQPSSIGFSSADALFTSMDPPGETRHLNPEETLPENTKTAQNIRNWWLRIPGTHTKRNIPE